MQNLKGKIDGKRTWLPNVDTLKVGWGCGYGPREHFNYAGGFNLFPIDKIPASDKIFIESSRRGGGTVAGN